MTPSEPPTPKALFVACVTAARVLASAPKRSASSLPVDLKLASDYINKRTTLLAALDETAYQEETSTKGRD